MNFRLLGKLFLEAKSQLIKDFWRLKFSQKKVFLKKGLTVKDRVARLVNARVEKQTTQTQPNLEKRIVGKHIAKSTSLQKLTNEKSKKRLDSNDEKS